MALPFILGARWGWVVNVPAGKNQYPLYTRLGGPQGLGGCGKISSPPGFDPQTTQPVAICNNDWAIPANQLQLEHTVAKEESTAV